MNYIYCVLILTCVLTMITMTIIVKTNNTLDKVSKRWFTITFLGIALAMLAEFSRAFLDIHPVSSTLYKFITLLEFCLTPMLPIPLSLAFGIRKPAIPTTIVLCFHVLLEVILFNSGLIFFVTENGVYSRGSLYTIYIISYVCSLIYLIMVFYFISRRFRNRHTIILIFSLVIIFAGIIPSLIDRNIKTAFLGMTFMGIILYNYYSELTKQDLSDEIALKNDKIKTMQLGTIVGIANLIESRDTNTGAHVKNTSRYVSMLVKAAMDEEVYPETINEKFASLIENAAPLHDIGKIAVSDNILNKPGKLTDEEFEEIKKHASEGGKMILKVLEDTSDQEYINIAYDVAMYHHEKWNGKGYPKGLEADAIPISARIVAIADVYDALTMERVYKKAFPIKTALSIILEESGNHFDPILAPLFVKTIIDNC